MYEFKLEKINENEWRITDMEFGDIDCVIKKEDILKECEQVMSGKLAFYTPHSLIDQIIYRSYYGLTIEFLDYSNCVNYEEYIDWCANVINEFFDKENLNKIKKRLIKEAVEKIKDDALPF